MAVNKEYDKLLTEYGDTGTMVSSDDVYCDFVLMQRDDMDIAARRKVISKHMPSWEEKDEDGNPKRNSDGSIIHQSRLVYIVREFGYNSSGEIVYYRNLEEITDPKKLPAWIPDDIRIMM